MEDNLNLCKTFFKSEPTYVRNHEFYWKWFLTNFIFEEGLKKFMFEANAILLKNRFGWKITSKRLKVVFNTLFRGKKG